VKFIATLWGNRKRPLSASVQERIAQTAVRASWDVKATPQRPPVKERPNA
jgi:hypothetical protein